MNFKIETRLEHKYENTLVNHHLFRVDDDKYDVKLGEFTTVAKAESFAKQYAEIYKVVKLVV